MDITRQRASTTMATIALVGVAMLAALILFSRFALGVEIFRCMSGESHAARASCLQSIAVEHLNRRF